MRNYDNMYLLLTHIGDLHFFTCFSLRILLDKWSQTCNLIGLHGVTAKPTLTTIIPALSFFNFNCQLSKNLLGDDNFIIRIIMISTILIFASTPIIFCKKTADLEKYVAASTEDLSRVFQLEKDLWNQIKVYREDVATKSDQDVIKKFLLETKLLSVIHDEDNLIHVSHPFNAYHCLKRTTKAKCDTVSVSVKDVSRKEAHN